MGVIGAPFEARTSFLWARKRQNHQTVLCSLNPIHYCKFNEISEKVDFWSFFNFFTDQISQKFRFFGVVVPSSTAYLWLYQPSKVSKGVELHDLSQHSRSSIVRFSLCLHSSELVENSHASEGKRLFCCTA
jgi:hypothetical protein